MKWAFIGQTDLDGMEDDAQFAREHGFLGLEFNYWGNFADLQVGTVNRMRKILNTYGVGTSALGLWGWNHLSGDDDERQQAHEMLDRGLQYADLLGADVLITGGGEIEKAPVEVNAGEFVEVFEPFLQRARDAGITMAIYAMHGKSFFNSVHAYEMVWEQLDGVTIKFDPANWAHHGDDYIQVAAEHGDKIGYIHIKEHLYKDDELLAQPAAGMGDIQWGKLLGLLYEADYNGYLSIEPHGPVWGQPPLREKMLLLSQRYVGQFIV